MNGKPSDIERRLRDLLADAPEKAEVSAETTARIERGLLESLQPVRPLPSREMLTLGFFLIFLAVAAALAAVVGFKGGRRQDHGASGGHGECGPGLGVAHGRLLERRNCSG